MKKLKVLCLITLVMLVFAACSSGKTTQPASEGKTPDVEVNQSEVTGKTDEVVEAEEVVKFALIAPLSGVSADWGTETTRAATVFADYLNSKGGVKIGDKTAKVEVVITDSTSDPTQVPTIVERVLSNDKYVATTGLATSPLTIPAIPIAEKYKVPIFSNGTSNQITSKGYKYIFRVTPGGPEFTEAQVGFLKSLKEQHDLAMTKVGIVYENTSWGVSQAEDSKKNVDGTGIFKTVVYESYTQGMSDASALVSKLKNGGSEIVFVLANPADCKLILNTMKTMKYDPLIIGGGGSFLFPSLLEELGEDTEGIVTVAASNWSNAFLNSHEELVDLINLYEKTYGYYINDHGVQTIVQMATVLEAIEKTGSLNGEDIANELHNGTFSNPYTRMMQPGEDIEYNDDGDVLPYALMVQWQSGKPIAVYPKEAASGELIIPKQIK